MKLPYTPKTVAEIPTEFQLVTNSQDIRATLDSIGQVERLEDVGCLFVSVGEGEYDSVFMSTRVLPMLNHPVYQLL